MSLFVLTVRIPPIGFYRQLPFFKQILQRTFILKIFLNVIWIKSLWAKNLFEAVLTTRSTGHLVSLLNQDLRFKFLLLNFGLLTGPILPWNSFTFIFLDKCQAIKRILDSGCGSVERVFASDYIGPRLAHSHHQNSYRTFIYCQLCLKDDD